MACPYFRPLREAEWSEGRAPLGGIFEGECARGGVCDARLCNFGYARSVCAHFPGEEEADAVRFSIAGEGRLIWILEKDHAPLKHGVIEIANLGGAPNERITAQAEVYVKRMGGHKL